MDKDAITKTVTQYMAAWNEPDDTARRALLEQCWSNAGVYLDPNVSLAGRDALGSPPRLPASLAGAPLPGSLPLPALLRQRTHAHGPRRGIVHPG